MMKTNNLGLYIHIPFCLKKCHYCDFYSEAGTDSALRAKYVDSLCSEIAWYGGRLGLTSEDGGRLVDTVFIGGGTPSILDAEQTVRIVSTIFRHFRVAEDAEISMECNPATLTAEKLAAYRKAGINRLSMGVQSMEPLVLSIMGRAHGPEDVISNVKLAREAGFDNINLDVMFGVPGQDMEIWKDTVHKVLALEPEHLSFYSLELAEGTEFYRRLASGQLKETAPEKDREMYHWMLETLDGCGYEHYEISNAAKPGRRCRHNLKYWNLEDYLGLGAAAHSFIADKRFSNPEDVSKYVDSWQTGNPAVVWHQKNTWEDSLTDYIFTALRKTEGIGKRDFAERFGREFWDVFADRRAEFEEYMAAGDAAEDIDAVRITRKGMDIASELIALFL
ncbi:MAG: radical SAM family heme chaperone HemW [Firmicutes bacterium]|nr:radical SAM family heme chaperone HemW [Bacillota bacterium]